MAKLKIQSHAVNLVFDNPSSWAQGGIGRCDTLKQEITINNAMPEDTSNAAVLHEVTHYISCLFNLELSESQVSILAIAWFDFIKSNPKFITEIVGFGFESTIKN